MRIATLNVQSLRLFPDADENPLRGARDSDVSEDAGLDQIDRKLTAELLRQVDADVVALQEVFDRETLDYFHDVYLVPAGVRPYPHRVCLPGNDGRGLDVAMLSRRPLNRVQSYASLKLADVGIDAPAAVDPDLPVFRRDCLMVDIGPLTLFVCHFKSPYPDPDKAWITRNLEARATRCLIERRFADPAKSLWLIIGDLNEADDGDAGHPRAIAPLEGDFSFDLMQRLPVDLRWTYFDPHSGLYHCPDALLASPALATRWPDAVPHIMRMGLGAESSRFRGPRLAGVGWHRPHASDHAAVVIDLDGLP